MSMRLSVLAAVLASTAALCAQAADPKHGPVAAADAENRLVGSWQVDPPPPNAAAPGPAGAAAGYKGGSVLQFNADHTMRSFPGCVPERAGILAASDSTHQTWHVTDDLLLGIRAEKGGDAYENGAPLQIDGDHLVIAAPGAPRTLMTRYAGPLPPSCD